MVWLVFLGLYFRCLSFRVVLVNIARPDGAFLFVVWFIHSLKTYDSTVLVNWWIRRRRHLHDHITVRSDKACRFAFGSFTENVWFVLVYWQTKANMLTLMLHETENVWFVLISLIGLYFRCLFFRVVLVNTARPDGTFLFVVWFIHWKDRSVMSWTIRITVVQKRFYFRFL
jgi:hypothetical protein